MSKVLIFGLGSIGQRHYNNLRQLRPSATIASYDPPREIGTYWGSTQRFIIEHQDADCAIIASPTECHLDQIVALMLKNIPFYCEKPLIAIEQYHEVRALSSLLPCAVGFQYRFHPVVDGNRKGWKDAGYLRFFARDDLQERYGPHCLEVMTSHPIDTACWILGEAERTTLLTNGTHVSGRIWHAGGGLSEYNVAMEAGPRLSRVTAFRVDGESTGYDLMPSDQMYVDALAAWLDWVEGKERDERTATLADGLENVAIMSQAKHT